MLLLLDCKYCAAIVQIKSFTTPVQHLSAPELLTR